MDDQTIQTIISKYAALYPPLILVEDAAAIARVPTKTIHDWSSQGFFDAFKSKTGRRLRLNLDDFVRFLISQRA
jgi:hypothetical protein